MTSQLLLTRHQIIHPASGTLKGQVLSQVWKCYWNHDQSHTFVPCTTLKQYAFMLHAILVGKPQNHMILAIKTTKTTTKTKHIKNLSSFCNCNNLIILQSCNPILTRQLWISELLGQKYKLYIMNFYVPSKWLGIVNQLQAIVTVQLHLD